VIPVRATLTRPAALSSEVVHGASIARAGIDIAERQTRFGPILRPR
jgi:hypothetical protein